MLYSKHKHLMLVKITEIFSAENFTKSHNVGAVLER